jgi:uncharacterized protein DUF4158
VGRERAFARRQPLTDGNRLALLGIPPGADPLARLFTLSRADRNLVVERRGDANCLGYAVQLALLRHPGTALAYLDQPADALVTWMAGQLDISAASFVEYARRPQTITDHARQLAATLGLRAPTMTDLPPMIEAAAEAARGTDHRPTYRRGGRCCRPHYPARHRRDRAHRHRRPRTCPQASGRCPGSGAIR